LAPPKGGLRSAARPGHKGDVLETMRHSLFHGTGGPTVLETTGKVPPLVGAIARSPDGPASSCGNRAEPARRGITRSMLSARNALASGPRPKHPGNVKLCESPGRAGGLPKGNYLVFAFNSVSAVSAFSAVKVFRYFTAIGKAILVKNSLVYKSLDVTSTFRSRYWEIILMESAIFFSSTQPIPFFL
jgi:hypothetical protein